MNDKQEHWLARPETIRRLWIGGIAVCALLVAADLFIHHHGRFGIDGTFGFGAWFGFAAGVAIVFFAKAFSVLVKRKDTYYD